MGSGGVGRVVLCHVVQAHKEGVEYVTLHHKGIVHHMEVLTSQSHRVAITDHAQVNIHIFFYYNIMERIKDIL